MPDSFSFFGLMAICIFYCGLTSFLMIAEKTHWC